MVVTPYLAHPDHSVAVSVEVHRVVGVKGLALVHQYKLHHVSQIHLLHVNTLTELRRAVAIHAS